MYAAAAPPAPQPVSASLHGLSSCVGLCRPALPLWRVLGTIRRAGVVRGVVMPEIQRPGASPDDVLAVWAAEDGRREACRRPLDRRWARVARRDDTQSWTAENL